MNKTEKTKDEISKCMINLSKIYLEDKKPIEVDLTLLDVRYKLTFDAEKLDTKTGEKDKVDVEKWSDILKPLDNTVINCKTEVEAAICCTLADNLGWKWWSGKSYTNNNWWNFYLTLTCYDFLTGFVCDIGYFQDKNYNIKSAEWFIDLYYQKLSKKILIKNE